MSKPVCFMNEWMLNLYSALLCIAVHPKRFTIMLGGGGLSSTTTSVQHPLGNVSHPNMYTSHVKSSLLFLSSSLSFWTEKQQEWSHAVELFIHFPCEKKKIFEEKPSVTVHTAGRNEEHEDEDKL